MSCGTLAEKGLNSLNYKTNTNINTYISQETFDLLKKGKTFFPADKRVEAAEFDGAVRAWLLDICKINKLGISTSDFLTKVKAINRESKAAALREPIETLLNALQRDYTLLLNHLTKASRYETHSTLSTIGSIFIKPKSYYDKLHDVLIKINSLYKQILIDKLKQISGALEAAKQSEAARLGISTIAVPEKQEDPVVTALQARLNSLRRTGTAGAGSGATRGGKRKTRRRQTKKRHIKKRHTKKRHTKKRHTRRRA